MAGPDRKGECPFSKPDAPARRLCQPVSRGGEWQCALAETDGGPCVEGPGPDGRCCQVLPPCTPQLSAKRRRGQWVLLVVVAVIGVLGLFSSGSWLQWFISPGPTDHRHAMIEQCDVCHIDMQHEFSALLQTGARGLAGEHEAAMGVCLDCHAIDAHPQLAHNAEPETLLGITRRLAGDDSLSGSPPQDLSCATCHTIHSGSGHTDQLSDAQCQSCHVEQFHSFQHGHPDFTQLPDAPAQIAFDHQQHQDQHYDKNSVAEFAPENCTDCHISTADTELKLADFDQMCADCHLSEDITTKLIDRIGPTTLFAVPNIDAEAVDIGFWPNCRTTQFKRLDDMPVLMRRLLETDPDTAAAIALLSEDGVAMNSLDDVSDAQRQAVIALAAAVRKLAADLAADDVIERLAGAEDVRSGRGQQIAQLIGLIPADVRRLANSAWFSEAAQAQMLIDADPPGLCPGRDGWRAMRDGVEKGRDVVRTNPGWYLQSKSSYMALSYVPQIHADPVMQLFSAVAGDAPVWQDDRDGFQCGKCHKVSADDDQTRITWPQPVETRRTLFSHTTHLATGWTCAHCHRLYEIPEEETVARIDHHPVRKTYCDECHQDGAVEQSCSDCHRYHWEDIQPGAALISTWGLDKWTGATDTDSDAEVSETE